MDSINRQDAIDAVQHAFDKETILNSFVRKVAIDALKALPSAQQEPQWIPVSERLPDNDKSVLISNSHGVTKAWWNGRFWSSIAVKKYKTVTAWMPLPEPYRGEGKEQC